MGTAARSSSGAEAGLDDTVADPTGRRGHARTGVAELIDVAIAGVYPSTTEAF
jgi:hypothetical protein